MPVPITVELSVYSLGPGEQFVALNGSGDVCIWRFRRPSSTYRFLTEALALESSVAAHLLTTREPFSTQVGLTASQWRRLRRLSRNPAAGEESPADAD